jgi:hypothetical protein
LLAALDDWFIDGVVAARLCDIELQRLELLLLAGESRTEGSIALSGNGDCGSAEQSHHPRNEDNSRGNSNERKPTQHNASRLPGTPRDGP